jgi:hypothetical protein
LAVGGLSSALIISWFDNFDSVVATDCSGVYEFMPSISACIGDFAPQRYIWRLCVALFVPIRFIDGFVIYYHNSGVDVVEGKENIVNRIAIWCYCVEYFSLFLLTYVSSSDHLGLHVLGFSCFMIFSLIYSSLTVLKRYWFYQRVQKSEYFIWKGRVYVMNVCFAIGAVIAWVISKRVCISGCRKFYCALYFNFCSVFAICSFGMGICVYKHFLSRIRTLRAWTVLSSRDSDIVSKKVSGKLVKYCNYLL